MRRWLIVWLAASAAGGALLALPDHGRRLIAFSGAHGLTAQDAAAVAVLVAGWLPIAALLWRRRGEPANHRWREVAAFLVGLGAGLLVASVFGDFEGWWVVGAAMLALVQIAALVALGRR